MRGKKILYICIPVLTALLGLACMFFLPGQIAVHWNELGVANGFLPNWAALPISLAVCGLCLLLWEMLECRFGDPWGKRSPILNGLDRA